jgi:hypothetical protein
MTYWPNGAKILSITTLSIMTLIIITLSIKGLICDTAWQQCYNAECQVLGRMLLFWVSLRWMLLCWVLLCRVSTLYGWLPHTVTIFCCFSKQPTFTEEVNSTQPSPSVRIPWFKFVHAAKDLCFNSEYFFIV